MRKIRPLLLVHDTSLVFHNTTDDDYSTWEQEGHLAYAEPHIEDYGGTTYTIHIGLPQAREHYTTAQLARFFSFEAYLNGIIVHEVSHIRFKTIPMRYQMNKLKHWLWNVLIDTHDEHWMGVYHPEYIQYVQAMLAILKLNSPVQEEGDLKRDMDTLYYLTRFGLLIDNYDPEFAGLCWPLVHAATTNLSHDNLYQALEAIYLYLALKYPNDSSFQEAIQDWVTPEEGTGGQDSTDIEDLQALGKLEKVEERETQEAAKQLAHGKLPGLEGVPIIQGENAAAFVRGVLAKDDHLIEELRNNFLLLWGEPSYIPAVEGEINWSKQQELYMSSFTHEEGQYYLAPLDETPSLKLVLSRDTSGSTGGIEEVYARAAVITLASLSDIDGVSIAELDFNSWTYQNLCFGESISDLMLTPLAAGGTSMHMVLEKLFALDWSGVEVKLHFVITDGYIDSPQYVFRKLRDLQTHYGVETVFIELIQSKERSASLGYASSWPGSFVSTIEDLPKNILKHVVKRLSVKRGAYA